MRKGNTITLNTLRPNAVRMNGQPWAPGGPAVGGGGIVPLPPTEPEEPEVPPVPTYVLAVEVQNGSAAATLGGVAVQLPYTANEGDTLLVTITPAEGYTFEAWADGNTDNPRSITMNADVVLSAECIAVPSESKYIQFADAEVERVLMSKGVSSDGVGITMEDAARVTSIGTWFLNNTTIESFNELRYFTALTEISPLYESGYGKSAFRGATNLREITIPKNVTRIGSDCFSKCSNLSMVTFEDSTKITDINSRAFAGCSSLAMEINFPNLSVLGANAFGKCTSLTKVVDLGMVSVLNGTSNAGMTEGEFYGCTSLSEIHLPSTMESIGINSFRNCSALEKVICRATIPPTLGSTTTFNNTNNCPIYVPDASLEAYKTATNWNSYADRIRPLSEIEGSLVFYDKLVGDGFAHINTEYYPKGTDSFAWDAERPKNYNKFIFGSKSSAFNVGALTSNEMQTYYLVGSSVATSVSEDNSQRFVRSMQVLAIDGSLHRVLTDNGVQTKDFGALGSYADKTSSSPLLLFACQVSQSSASPDRLYQGAIHSFAITGIDGNTIMSLKPCTWNGEAGMWDEIGGKFYGNASSNGYFEVAND